MTRLNQHWIDHMVRLPETGMGWQNVMVITKDNSTPAMVFGSQELNIDISVGDIVDISLSHKEIE